MASHERIRHQHITQGTFALMGVYGISAVGVLYGMRMPNTVSIVEMPEAVVKGGTR